MSYPKCCEKCDQFGAWCFCVVPVEPDLGMIWLGYDASIQCYTASHIGYVLCLDNSAKATKVIAKLQGPIDTATDEYGRVGIPYTDRDWNDLIDVGKFV
jgi:hypothetical protein